MNVALKSSYSLDKLAKRYIWWETPEWAYAHATVFLANVMNLGSWEDIKTLRETVGDNELQAVLLDAPPGYFNYRSWDYWHVKFDMPISPLPTRKL